MSGPTFSVVIPYKQRLESITAVFAALADQTMDHARFEVIVGAMEYSEEYVAACREYTDRLTLISVLEDAPWNVGHARNLGIRQAGGDVIVFMDADMIPPAHMLQTLYDKYFADNQNVCVLGQALGYSCVVEDVGKGTGLVMASVDNVEAQPYSHFRDLITSLQAIDGVWVDDRTVLDSVPLPWALCWSGLVALPAATVRKHDLYFDEGFRGWGSEDQEWGYRIHATGTPLVLGQDVYAMHLPHARQGSTNTESYRANSSYFLTKWPCLEVEVTRAYGWEEGNRVYPQVRAEVAAAVAEPAHTLGVVRGLSRGTELVVVGAEVDSERRTTNPGITDLFDEASTVDVLPLAGLALPYPDKGVDECRVLPSILSLSSRYRDTVLAEAGRVAANVVAPAPE
jgi:hypothetical protein